MARIWGGHPAQLRLRNDWFIGMAKKECCLEPSRCFVELFLRAIEEHGSLVSLRRFQQFLYARHVFGHVHAHRIVLDFGHANLPPVF